MNTLALSADHLALRRLRPWLEAWVETTEVFPIELCVHELAANVIDHAGASQLTITGAPTTTGVEITMIDDGGPYETRTQDPHPRVRGYGQLIAASLATDIAYERIAGENHWRTRFDTAPSETTNES